MLTYATTPENAEHQWMSLCAKHGIPEAVKIGNQDPVTMRPSDLHELRKTARRAVNAITSSLKPGDHSDNITDAITFAGNVIANITQSLERREEADLHFGRKQSTNVLRNAADFERHYGGRKGPDEPFDISDFLKGVANLRTTQSVSNALAVGTDSTGGYAVPSLLMPGILAALAPASSLLQAGAGIVPLEEGAKSYTTAAVDTIPTAAWRAEGGVLAESDPAFRAVVATPRSLSFMFKVSRELLADAVGLTEALNTSIGQAFAKELDRVGLRGTGTAPQPRGILNTSGIQAVGNGANGAALAGYANLFSAVQSLMAADAPMPGAAIMSPRSLVKLGGLVDTTGQPVAMPGMLEPVRLIASSQVPNNLAVGSSTDCSEIYVGDFSKMYFAMREAVSVQLLNERFADTGEIGFACHVRADVVLTYPAAFAVVTGVRP